MLKELVFINDKIATPKYEQICNSLLDSIKSGRLKQGDKVPSINDICDEFHLARETVVKSFNILKTKGVLNSVHGKGFYVNSVNVNSKHNVFILLDTFTAYKEVMYEAITEAFGSNTVIDLHFHHFNIKVFEKTIKENIGKYTSFIVLPFDHKSINKSLSLIPHDKLYMMDRYPKDVKAEYVGVYQDFDQDIYNALESIKDKHKKYKELVLVFRNIITDPPSELITGIKRFCKEYKIKCRIQMEAISKNIKKGEAYIVIDDKDLVNLVMNSQEKGLEIGKDIGIISYNETPLKKVVGTGISVISTDFAGMGTRTVEMIINNEHKAIKNPCSFIDRGSY